MRTSKNSKRSSSEALDGCEMPAGNKRHMMADEDNGEQIQQPDPVVSHDGDGYDGSNSVDKSNEAVVSDDNDEHKSKQEAEADDDDDDEDDDYEQQEDEQDDSVYEENDYTKYEGGEEAADLVNDMIKPKLSRLLTVELQSEDPKDVLSAAEELDNVLENQKEAYNVLLALGGHTHLLILMKKWGSDENVQGWLLSCLAWICIWSNNTDNKHEGVLAAIQDLGGMDLILGAMKQFPKSSSIHRDCLNVIHYLYIDTNGLGCLILSSSMTETDFVSLVYKKMQDFPKEYDVQTEGFRLLNDCADLKLEAMKELKAEKAMALAAAAAKNFPGDDPVNKDINKAAFEFLQNLGTMFGYLNTDTNESEVE